MIFSLGSRITWYFYWVLQIPRQFWLFMHSHVYYWKWLCPLKTVSPASDSPSHPMQTRLWLHYFDGVRSVVCFSCPLVHFLSHCLWHVLEWLERNRKNKTYFSNSFSVAVSLWRPTFFVWEMAHPFCLSSLLT